MDRGTASIRSAANVSQQLHRFNRLKIQSKQSPEIWAFIQGGLGFGELKKFCQDLHTDPIFTLTPFSGGADAAWLRGGPGNGGAGRVSAIWCK
jgi:hypothetical protein